MLKSKTRRKWSDYFTSSKNQHESSNPYADSLNLFERGDMNIRKGMLSILVIIPWRKKCDNQPYLMHTEIYYFKYIWLNPGLSKTTDNQERNINALV